MLPFKVFKSEALTDESVTVAASLPKPLTPFPLLVEAAYKVFRSDVIKSINLKENRFGFEPEITAKISKKDLRIYEVGVKYFGRKYSEGKKITWKDGFSAIKCILKYNIFD